VVELEKLIMGARGGDQAAYAEIVRRFQDMAYGYAYAILGDFHLAQDAAQGAFVEAYQCLAHLREPEAFPGWFKRFVLKHCDRLTRGKRVETVPLDAAYDVASGEPDPHEATAKRELRERVLQAVRDLPDNEREVTTLYYMNGYSQSEIAEFLEVPATTVKSRLHTSRQRLKERMTEMVQDTFKEHALPESFTQETLEKTVARARELQKEGRYDEAEGLMHNVLTKVPGQPEALKELMRSMRKGTAAVERGEDVLAELVEHGRALLASASEDDQAHFEMARMLLILPAMPQAIEFINAWITKMGPNLEKLAMLTWGKGCVAEYDEAESVWHRMLAMAEDREANEVLGQVALACYNLVDCFAAAGETERAQRVAQEGWETCLAQTGWEACLEQGHIPGKETHMNARWLTIFHQAGLGLDPVAKVLLERWSSDEGVEGRAEVFQIRAWVDDPKLVAEEYVSWVPELIVAKEWKVLESTRYRLCGALEMRVGHGETLSLVEAILELLQDEPSEEAKPLRRRLNWCRYPVWHHIKAGELDKAEALARRQLDEMGVDSAFLHLGFVAFAAGVPTPPELMEVIAERGVDSYSFMEWYVVAREAAAAGDENKAFDALRRALSYWTNPPLGHYEIWIEDAYWGELREHPEFKRIFQETRERIGPIYGELSYLGW
jgi:RNA polymerase sigma factor (sigma-70 family)